MRLGLVTDIHNNSVELAKSLELFRTRNVDQVITLGDTCDGFAPAKGADEVAIQLSAAHTIGVWGNHDFALCNIVSEKWRRYFDSTTLEFMHEMQPYLEIDDCYFSHRDASIDAFDIAQLWSDEGELLDLHLQSCATAGLAAVSHARQFIGHYHQWWAATTQGKLDWDGTRPLLLQPGERYFIVIAATFQGCCAILDTERGILEPFRNN
jgi:Calcineurin-like phosphoesterase superfamily domain